MNAIKRQIHEIFKTSEIEFINRILNIQIHRD